MRILLAVWGGGRLSSAPFAQGGPAIPCGRCAADDGDCTVGRSRAIIGGKHRGWNAAGGFEM